jgi:hypothetical protein
MKDYEKTLDSSGKARGETKDACGKTWHSKVETQVLIHQLWDEGIHYIDETRAGANTVFQEETERKRYQFEYYGDK